MIDIRSNEPTVHLPAATEARRVERKLDKIQEEEKRQRKERLNKRRALRAKKKRAGSQDHVDGNDVDVRA